MQRMMATPLPILLTLILLPPIAFASPPDPSWIVGFYDGADGDDVVNLVYESSASNSAAPSHTRPLPWLLVSLQGIVRNVAASSRFTLGPRSPPVPSVLGRGAAGARVRHLLFAVPQWPTE